MTSLLVLSLASSSLAVSTLMRLGCDGGFDVMEKAVFGPMSVRINAAPKLMSFIDSYSLETANDPQCGCPGLGADNLNKFFKSWSPKFLFNLAKGFDAETLPTSLACAALAESQKDLLPKIDLPSTCNAERWNAGKGCQAALARKMGDMKIVLRMEKCANTDFPFFELKCEGADCSTLLAPCSQDGDCTSGASMSCLEFANSADQCGIQTCGPYASTSTKTVSASQCVAGSYQPKQPDVGCMLNGVKYGTGFTYYIDEMDMQRTQTITKVADIKKCVRIECSGTQWLPSQPDSPDRCFEALMMRKPAKGDQCSSAGDLVPNTRWPYSRDNTCNWRDLVDSVEFGITQEIKPFAIGATRLVSNADESLGGAMAYDPVDFVADPFGCKHSNDVAFSLLQLARKMHDRSNGRAPATLKNTGQIGLCMPGQGYSLQERMSSSGGWTRYDIQSTETDPAKIVTAQFGITCDMKCENSSMSTGHQSSPWAGGKCTASCGSDTLKYDGAAYGDKEKFDGASMRKVRRVAPVTPGATVLGHLNCIGSAALFPNSDMLGMEMSVTNALEFAVGLRDQHRDTYKCRAKAHNGPELSNDQYDVRSFTLSNPLYFMTSPIAEQLTDIGVKFRDLRTRLQSTGAGRLQIPQSCTFDNWFSQGQCRMTFTGLGQPELLGEQADLNMYVSVCPGSFLPEVYIECVGSGCKAFEGPIPCGNDADCGVKGLRCQQFVDLTSSSGSMDFGSSSENGDSTRPATIARSSERFYATVHAVTGQSPAFTFVAPIDISKSDLRVTIDYPSSNTNGDVPVIKGPYTGKFASVDVQASYSTPANPVCDDDSLESEVKYKTDGVYVSAKCGCTLNSARRRSANAKQVVNAVRQLVKRQVDMPPVDAAEESSSSALGVLAGGLTGFRPDLDVCTKDVVPKKLLPSIVALFAGKPFVSSNTGVCFIDTKSVDAQGRHPIEGWAESQVKIDGSIIQLTNLKSWKEGSSVQPIDDGKTIQETFKDADWLEKTGRFCVSCPEGVNKDIGTTGRNNSGSSLAIAVASMIAAVVALTL